MIILEIFFALFIVIVLLFGKIEFSSKAFSLSLIVAGKVYPLISITRKRDTNGANVFKGEE